MKTLLEKGDVFTIDGVYFKNPGSRRRTRRLLRFVVTATRAKKKSSE